MSSLSPSRRSVTLRYALGILFTGALLLGAAAPLQAQLSATPFRQFQGTYVPISGGTVLCSAGTILVPMTSSSLDDGYWTIALPFVFKFNNINQSTIYPCTNGYISFGVGTTSLTGCIGYVPAGSQGAIAGISRDLDLRSGTPAPEVSYATSGIAPDRVFTIQYKSIKTYPATSYPADDLNFQIKLYETSNRIDIVYGTFVTTYANATAQVGIRGASTAMTEISNRMVTLGTHTWPTSVAGTASTSTCTYSASLFPPSGWTFSWGCNIPSNSATFEIVDANGDAQPYVISPGVIYAKYTVSYPLGTPYTIAATMKFYRVGDASGVPVFVTTFNIDKPAGIATGMVPVSISVAPGFYRVDVTYRMQNNCGTYEDYPFSASLLSLAPGTEPCMVWPGDVNNDGIVNFGDRKALMSYISEANLRPTWLSGPARYRSDALTNPLTYFTWVAQPGVPWNTASGCFMDADGNGTVNNFDILPIKTNWMKQHNNAKAMELTSSALTFDMSQNYPNPFNPTTSVQYSLPESGSVTLVVTDHLGRTIATLVNGFVQAGTRSATFDASSLPSGSYFATISIMGQESGLTFSKSIRMTLLK